MLTKPEVGTSWTRDITAAAARDLAAAAPGAILGWALSAFAPAIALASSFGAEDVVLIDIWSKIDQTVRVFTLDTGRLPEETYEVMERIRERYGIAIATYFPEAEAVEALERERGYYSFRRSVEERKHCCGIRKVGPLRRALAPLRAWVTGLRQEQSPTRTGIAVVEWDAVPSASSYAVYLSAIAGERGRKVPSVFTDTRYRLRTSSSITFYVTVVPVDALGVEGAASEPLAVK